MGYARVAGLAGLIALMAGMSLAEAPKTSLRPKARPVAASPVVLPGTLVAVAQPLMMSSLRPRARPATLRIPVAQQAVVQAAAVQAPVAAAPPKKGLFGFLRPGKRPDDLAEPKLASAAAVRILPGKEAVISKQGAVCGVPDIKGTTLSPITGKLQGCGIANPVRVTSVAGVRLSTPATLNCETAKALSSWVKNGVEPAYGKGQVVELQIAASYACRGRNNKKGAKISEHGRGNAIDISGLTFANGKTDTVLRNFNKPMRRAHNAACGIFGTTLGPGSDGYHEDHLHFDVARYNNGTYCR